MTDSIVLYAVSSVAWSALGFVSGWIVASLRRDLTAVKEAVVPNSTFLEIHGHRLTTQNATRILGIVVLLLAIFTVLQNTATSQHLSRVTDCQARYNSSFAKVVNYRAALQDEDRNALNSLTAYLFKHDKPSEEGLRRKAFAKYVATVQSNNQERSQHPLPTLPEGGCK